MWSLPVKLSGYPRLAIDAEAFSLWFPDAFAGWGFIHADAWIDDLYDRIYCPCRYSKINRDDISRSLYALFRCLEYLPYRGNRESRSQIRKNLEEKLSEDRRRARHVYLNPGYSTCRHRFVTWAEIAYNTNSQLLAEALVEFATRSEDSLSEDRSEYIRSEWEPAVRKMQEVLQANVYGADDIFAVPYPGWGRGRRHRRRPLDWDYRSSSAPPVRRCPSLDLQLARLSPAILPRTPPLMSPARLITANPLDEVDALAWNQANLEHEMQDVKREVRMLQWRGY